MGVNLGTLAGRRASHVQTRATHAKAGPEHQEHGCTEIAKGRALEDVEQRAALTNLIHGEIPGADLGVRFSCLDLRRRREVCPATVELVMLDRLEVHHPLLSVVVAAGL